MGSGNAVVGGMVGSRKRFSEGERGGEVAGVNGADAVESEISLRELEGPTVFMKLAEKVCFKPILGIPFEVV